MSLCASACDILEPVRPVDPEVVAPVERVARKNSKSDNNGNHVTWQHSPSGHTSLQYSRNRMRENLLFVVPEPDVAMVPELAVERLAVLAVVRVAVEIVRTTEKAGMKEE